MNTNTAIVEAALADWASRDRAAALRLFVPEARKLASSSRVALGHALRESAWMGSDARVNDAKSAWWLEELALADRAQPRHPLTGFLVKDPTPPDFAQLSREFARLRTIAPEDEGADVLAALSGLERVLWFGPATADSAACSTRARAALIDVLQRRGRFGNANVANGMAESAAAAHASALRAAPARDAWTAARRAQALSWIDARGGRIADHGMRSRWREIWAVWRAVQAARWRRSVTMPSGGENRGA